MSMACEAPFNLTSTNYAILLLNPSSLFNIIFGKVNILSIDSDIDICALFSMDYDRHFELSYVFLILYERALVLPSV